MVNSSEAGDKSPVKFPAGGSGKKSTRIQREKSARILEAALDAFSSFGLRGATLDQIADRAGISKPNLLYYFPGKEAIHRELLMRLLDMWLDPLRSIEAGGDPVEEIVGYVMRKLEMARDYPRESRLFANEIIQDAPTIREVLAGPLKELVDEKAELFASWAQAGKIADVDPYHLIFSIWATTQHYADFAAQVRLVLDRADMPFDDATEYLETLFRRLLSPA